MRFERVTEVEEEMRRIKESIGMQKKKKKKKLKFGWNRRMR